MTGMFREASYSELKEAMANKDAGCAIICPKGIYFPKKYRLLMIEQEEGNVLVNGIDNEFVLHDAINALLAIDKYTPEMIKKVVADALEGK